MITSINLLESVLELYSLILLEASSTVLLTKWVGNVYSFTSLIYSKQAYVNVLMVPNYHLISNSSFSSSFSSEVYFLPVMYL